MMQDKTLVCKDCSKDFIFSVREQEFYAEKGFQNEPSRCKDCRDMKKSQYNRNSGARREREMYDAVCSECGKETKIPFKPHLEKPVYCNECFESHKSTY